jgi:hypothetical protein
MRFFWNRELFLESWAFSGTIMATPQFAPLPRIRLDRAGGAALTSILLDDLLLCP